MTDHNKKKPPTRRRITRARAWRDAEDDYQRFLAANPSNNRDQGSTDGGGSNGRKRSRRSKEAPR
jgi:hypothetical protein